jgi:hypothetical protein
MVLNGEASILDILINIYRNEVYWAAHIKRLEYFIDIIKMRLSKLKVWERTVLRQLIY